MKTNYSMRDWERQKSQNIADEAEGKQQGAILAIMVGLGLLFLIGKLYG